MLASVEMLHWQRKTTRVSFNAADIISYQTRRLNSLLLGLWIDWLGPFRLSAAGDVVHDSWCNRTQPLRSLPHDRSGVRGDSLERGHARQRRRAIAQKVQSSQTPSTRDPSLLGYIWVSVLYRLHTCRSGVAQTSWDPSDDGQDLKFVPLSLRLRFWAFSEIPN